MMPSSSIAGNTATAPNRQAGALVMTEQWWRDRYDEIAEHGYELRPRYHPNWQPSWLKSGKDFYTVEDGQPTKLRAAMDAIRVRDSVQVMLKRVLPEEGPHELGINELFSSPEFATMPDNQCVPLLDIIELQSPEPQKLMVFPLLRPFNRERNDVHRDCTANNVTFGASGTYPNGFHPVKNNRSKSFEGTEKAYTRTQRPPVYYPLDFGLSRQYISRDVTDEPLRGGDKSIPEHRSKKRCNPFQTAILTLLLSFSMFMNLRSTLKPMSLVKRADKLMHEAEVLFGEHQSIMRSHDRTLAEGRMLWATDFRHGVEKEQWLAQARQAKLYFERTQEALDTIKDAVEKAIEFRNSVGFAALVRA